MSRNIAVLIFVVALGTLACSITAQGDAESTAESLAVTQTATTSASTLTPTASPTATATQASGNSTADVTCTPRADWQTYTVVQGDTLGQLAARTGATIQQLVDGSCLSNADSIRVGQTLRVPRQPDPQSPSSGSGPIALNPSERPPLDGCSAVSPNAAGYINVYTDTNVNSTVNARLFTWAPLVARNGNWYQITIPDSGLNYVEADAVLAIGNDCPAESGLGPLNLKPSDNPPSDICAVRNPNPGVPVNVQAEDNTTSITKAQLITWAPYLSTEGDWYTIIIPESGLNYVQAAQVELVGASCP